MKRGLVTALILSLVFGSIFFAGCARAAQRTIESAIERELEEEGITVEEDEEKVTMKQETDSGEMEMSWGSSDLPEGVPSEIPFYPDMSIDFSAKESSSSDDQQRESFQVVGQSTDPVEAVVEWHESKLKDWSDYSTTSWSSDDDVGHLLSAQMGSIDEGRRLKVDVNINYNKDQGIVQLGYYIEDTRPK